MIDIDNKHLASCPRVGHRITGVHLLASSRGATGQNDDVGIINTARLGYGDVVTDEKQPTTFGLLQRVVALI
jgi:hypothetical protein